MAHYECTHANFFMREQRGFTLAELLIVISIIGLLSSVVLVSTKRATKSAKRAVVLQFAAQVHHAVGAYAAGIWDFDDQQNPTKDSSGNNNNGTLNNFPANPWKCVSADPENTPSGQGCSLEFDGLDDYVQILDAPSMAPNPSLNPKKGITIALWLYLKEDPDCDGNNNWRVILMKYNNGGGYGIKLEENRRINFFIRGRGYLTGTPGGLFDQDPADILPIQEWTFVVLTYNSLNPNPTQTSTIYLNGQIPPHAYCFGGLCPAGEIESISPSPLNINYNSGSPCPNGNGNFLGKIDNVRIYEEPLTYAQIQKLYAEGLRRYLTVNSKQ